MIDITTINPIRSLLLLDTTVREEKSAGGVLMPVMPAGAKITRTTKIGTIIKVGPEADASLFQPGIKVVVAKYASDHIDHEGNRYHFAQASEVMAIIQPNSSPQ